MASSGPGDSSCSINQVSDSSTDVNSHEYCSKEQSTISCLSPLSSNHVKDESSKQTPLLTRLVRSPQRGQELASQPLDVNLDRTSDRDVAVSEMYKQTKQLSLLKSGQHCKFFIRSTGPTSLSYGTAPSLRYRGRSYRSL